MADVAQMDFMTYADVTNRYKEIREMLELVCGMPVGFQSEEAPTFVIHPELKVAAVSNLLERLAEIPEAPTRESISKEMVNVERIGKQAEMTLAGVDALGRELKATLEAFNIMKSETTTDGTVVSQDTNA